jgi:hypothetical protein
LKNLHPICIGRRLSQVDRSRTGPHPSVRRIEVFLPPFFVSFLLFLNPETCQYGQDSSQEIPMASIKTVAQPKLNAGLLAAMLCTGLLSACATGPAAQPDAGKPAPAALKPADNERAAFTWHAVGSQIYECRAGDKGGWAWVFVAPEADLFNQKDEKVGTHGAGPHWTALDGSKTLGTVKARADGERPADIPLLLLSAKSAGSPGKMAAVTSVQRLNTEGGNAPAKGCAVQADAGKRVKEGYRADYVFFAAKNS